jgi:signal transduction histidine kinase
MRIRLPRLAGRRASIDTARPADHAGPSVPWLTVRVAAAATLVVGLAYVFIAVAVASAVSANLTAEVDRNLTQALSFVARGEPLEPGPGFQGGRGFDPDRLDPSGVPVLLWQITPGGVAQAQGLNEVQLPAAAVTATAPTTIAIDGTQYRVAGKNTPNGRLVAGQSLDGAQHTLSTLVTAEVGIGLALLIFVFGGALAIGWRVATPIERARQRQLEFTADASHELRTPLSVVEAQTSLALARARDKTWDAAAFGRIDAELRRMRRLLDDMLWLARFDSSAGAPAAEPVDLSVLAAQTADRFAAVAEARGQELTVEPGPGGPAGGSDDDPEAGVSDTDSAIVTAPPEWLDRLVGVLLDNACKYSPDGGSVRVSVASEGRRVRLTVDDSGPGIPPEQRRRVFDRFHRATEAPGGAGLGLAIAGAIARSTGGRWTIGESPLGGARLSVSWPRTLSR